jgi:colanic acid/amylovoran biosynthesis protein
MRLLVDPSSFDCRNMGDVAMLQVAMTRLRALWPDAVIDVITSDPAALEAHVPDATPVPNEGRVLWFTERYLLGGLHDRMPHAMSRQLVHWKRALRRRRPALVSRAVRWKLRARGVPSDAPAQFLAAVDRADAVLVSGAATFADGARKHALLVLNTLELAADRGKPTALLGQGIGPVTGDDLRARASAVLPAARMIAVREAREGGALLAAFGVPADRIAFTGDDAIELAYDARPRALGDAVGVNVRVAEHSGLDAAFAAALGEVLRRFAREHGVSLVPLPIAFHKFAQDPAAIRAMVGGSDAGSDGGAALTEPLAVIREAGRCRIAVTGAYHAAVFALAQGVSVVCLARSPYYVFKFNGLAEQFGDACAVVRLDQGAPIDDVAAAMDRQWDAAPARRDAILSVAAAQRAAGRAAYARLPELLAPRTASVS